jgi:hypothetical protein
LTITGVQLSFNQTTLITAGRQVMASYFDLPPQKAAPPATIEQLPQEQRKQLGRTSSLMSPAVTQILEGLVDDHSDSSSEEDDSLSEEEEDKEVSTPSKNTSAEKILQNKQKHNSAQAPRPSSLSPNRSRSHSKPSTKKISNKPSSARADGDNPGRLRNKQPHMARFHSLRSMLFQQKIEDRLKSATQEDTPSKTDSAETWKTQHEERQMHSPTTSEKHAQAKSGIGSRLKMTLRRMTTKDAGGMEKIKEDGTPVEFNDRPSTASSENEEKKEDEPKETNAHDAESIKDCDVEELVRWASRRGPSNDSEAPRDDIVESAKEEDDREELGDPDIKDLVRHARRKSAIKDVPKSSDEYTGYSDASTESDIELSSEDEEDADDLVRWVSRRERSKAGPVRRNLQRPELDSDVEEHYDSDVPELGRWFKRYDATSGESAATTPTKDTFEEQQIEEEEENRGRPRSRDLVEPPAQEKTHITPEDINELVRWASSKQLKRYDTPNSETQNHTETLDSEQYEKKHAVGMSIDKGSLSHSDVQDLIEHARRTSATTEEAKPDDTGVERGDLKKMQRENTPPVRDPQLELADKREEIKNKEKEREKEEHLGMSMQDASLSHGDIEDLLAHVRTT